MPTSKAKSASPKSKSPKGKTAPPKSKSAPKSKASPPGTRVPGKGKTNSGPKGILKPPPKGKAKSKIPSAKQKNVSFALGVESQGDDETEEVLDPDDEDGDSFPLEVEGRKKRVKPTIYDHISHYDQLLELIRAEIDRKSRTKENGVRTLQKARKMVEIMRKELAGVTRSKEAKAALSTRKNTASGFTMKYYVSESLAEFLQIDAAVDTISRIDATRAICVYAHLKPDEKREGILAWAYLNPNGKRNLQNPENKKTIIPDKVLSNLILPVDQGSAPKKGTKPEPIEYTSIQRLISHHFLEAVQSTKNEEIDEEADDGEEIDEEADDGEEIEDEEEV